MYGKDYDLCHLLLCWPYEGDIEYVRHNPLGVQANVIVKGLSLLG